MDRTRASDEHRIDSLPPALRRFIRLERFNLHKPEFFQPTANDPSFDTRYLPQNCDPFPLPCYWIARRHFLAYGEQAASSGELRLLEPEGPQSRVIFPVHPLETAHYERFLIETMARDTRDEGLELWAVPTSSVRTLLVWPGHSPERAVFVKTSLHSKIFGDRHIYRRKAAGAVGLSWMLQQGASALPDDIGFMWETASFLPRAMPHCGVIIRPVPAGLLQGSFGLTPLFALMGGSGRDRPVLMRILEKTGATPLDFVADVLCTRFARLWLEMSLRRGLLLETHGQDLMLAVSHDWEPLDRFFYRDFEGLMVDWDLRRGLGLEPPHPLPHAWRWHEAYATWGYPYSQLAWWKWKTSLFGYLHFVLQELELQMRDWQSCGLLEGEPLKADALTALFSHRMRRSLEQMLNTRITDEYDIYRSLNRFVKFLMGIRSDLMRP